jgi:GT2 family glycosyltransferase
MVNFTMLVHNRPELTKQGLESIGHDSQINALVRGDDFMDEETREVMDNWSDRNAHKGRITYHATIPCGTGGARNDVIKTSEQAFGRGDYLYLSDNDVFFLTNWLSILIDCYEVAWDSGCRVLGGVGHPYHQQGQVLGICSTNVRYAVHEVAAQPLQSMLMKWEVWDKYGPFCQTTPGKVCQSEDVAFARKIQADGYKLGVVSPALVVNTGITNSFGERIPGWELVKQQCPAGVLCE